MGDDVIEAGKYVVVQKVGGEHCRVVQFTKSQKVVVEKLRFLSDGCIGQRFGMFEISGMRAAPITSEQRLNELKSNSGENVISRKNGSNTDDNSTEKVSESKELNKEFVEQCDVETGQLVTQDEVLEMKSDGTTAKALVEKLVKGNKGFVNRTDYAQSKYIRRKMKKHSDRIFVMKPTIRLLANSYYTKDTEKFGMLRIDQLGLLLQMGHVVHNRNVLVVDQILGIVIAAVLERLSGNGSCIHVHRGIVSQSIPCLHSMNFDDEILASYHPVRIRKLLGQEGVKEGMVDVSEICDGDDSLPLAPAEDVNVKRAERLAREQRGLGFIAAGVDSLVIACRSIEVVDILRILFPKLKPSGAVSIYHPDLQALIRAQAWLMENHCLNVALSEQMYRVHQVLHDRTHPLMAQYIAGGYILSGIKVLPPTVS